MEEQLEKNSKALTFRYKIRFNHGLEKSIEVKLDEETLSVVLEPKNSLPEWTNLNFHKCPNCTLDESRHRHCPVAVSIADLVDFLKDYPSYEEVEVRVETRERNYQTRASLQSVAGSIMGLLMATSGCPILNKMRLMAETHLPFASWKETTYRIVSMYLFVQYVLFKHGRNAVWDLDGIVHFYEDINLVNKTFCERLNAIRREDGDVSINAVNVLNSMASIASTVIKEEDISHWEKIILAHWG